MSWGKDVGRSVRERTFLIFARGNERLGEFLKIRNRRHKVNKDRNKLKTIGQNKRFMIIS